MVVRDGTQSMEEQAMLVAIHSLVPSVAMHPRPEPIRMLAETSDD